MGNRKHHADDTPRRPLDDAQPRFIASSIAAHGFHAKHVAHILQLLNLVVEPAHLALFQLHAAEFFAAIDADTPDDPDHASALFQAHIRDLSLSNMCRAGGLIDCSKDTVPCRSAVCRRRCRPTAQRQAGLSPLQLDTNSRDNLSRDIRDHLLLVCHACSKPVIYGFSSTLPPTSTVSTMPTMTASTGASFVAGVRRAELPCVNNTHSPTPAPTLSTATTELPEISSLLSLLIYGWISSSFIPRNFAFFCVETTLPITFAINMPAHLMRLGGSTSARSYFGNTDVRLPCGRAITCTLCTSPTAFAAAAPASTAARTLPTSP